MVRLVLFDIDGTLIRTGGAGVAAFARVSEYLYRMPDGTSGMQFHGATDSGLVRQFLRAGGFPDTPAERQRFLDAYVFWLDHGLRISAGMVCPGIGEFLGALRRLKPRPTLGLLTGNIRLGAELKLRAHGLWREFELGGFGDDHEDRSEIARTAHWRGEKYLGDTLRGDEILVIGDTTADVRCGRSIGARCLAVATGGVDKTALEASAPDWCLKDLRGLNPAVFCG